MDDAVNQPSSFSKNRTFFKKKNLAFPQRWPSLLSLQFRDVRSVSSPHLHLSNHPESLQHQTDRLPHYTHQLSSYTT